MAKIIGENIDTLCNFQMLPGKGDLPRGHTKVFYDFARRKQKEPLTYLAATALKERVKAGDRVLIVTGCRSIPHMPFGETDGPIGAVALARALTVGLGAKPIISVEEDNADPTIATIRAAGCYLRDEKYLDSVPGSCAIDFYPLGPEAGKEYALELIEKHNPAAIIFCEKHGPNSVGEYHSVTGYRIDKNEMANTWFLLEEAEKRNILTIGTGDGGNEIGNGLIWEEIHGQMPGYGDWCRCGCGGGIATIAKTDIFVAASISNWGLYGVAAMLAFLLGDVDVMHDEDTERRMVEACAHYGSLDGIFFAPIPRVDGISLRGGQAFVTLLREIITNGLREVARYA
ncbi:MAG TPA: DUF4392 domain-containing protein [Firmicutes bacterium]|nr:DUF4392 domain-containing protein [Bacillota bacterium]